VHFASLGIDVGRQASPQQIFFGTEAHGGDLSKYLIPIEWIATSFYVVIALAFVGLGQAMGRALAEAPNRLLAYSIDILGSLAGIAAFSITSFCQCSPVVWFAIGTAAVCSVLRRRSRFQFYCLVALMALIAIGATRDSERLLTYWSPYYKVTYHPRNRMIETNQIGHQVIVNVQQEGPAYSLPYLLNRDSGGRPFEDVLIVGAGSGNDVAAALWHGAQKVDAVEIDPAIQRLGRIDHPNRPYADFRVAAHLDDGRRFLKATGRSFDLITFALVDSLVLHSGYSSLRLESFLFTEEAFREVKSRLKPGGAFVMYNAYRQGWVVGRLAALAEKVFGTRPLVLSMPHARSIRPEDNLGGRVTCLIVGMPGAPFVELTQSAFATHGSFWLAKVPAANFAVNGFGASHPNPGRTDWQSVPQNLAVNGYRASHPASDCDDRAWTEIRPVRVETAGVGRLPSDASPFLYLRDPVVPGLNLRAMVLVALASLGIFAAIHPVRPTWPSGRMFFLGAGFMLLEAKSIVQMALLFGSTWLVSAVVTGAILLTILAANLFVTLARPTRTRGIYLLLASGLGINAVVPMSELLPLAGPIRALACCALVFAPLFFAGVIFAISFRDSSSPALALGSNVAGVIVGGMAENLSLILGFNNLVFVAIAIYGLSALGNRNPQYQR
jgi:SAM-dependent methyltransferase